MSGCHYTGCVDLNIPCSLVHLSFCGSDLRAAIACFKVPSKDGKKTKQVHAAFWPFVYNISVKCQYNSNITWHIIYKMKG